jgi:hypothetical protein
MLKHIGKRTGYFVSAFSLLIVILAFSCFSEPTTPPQGNWYPDFASPYQCISNLVYCFGNYQTEPKIIDKYKQVLDLTYVFYFKPDDIGQDVGGYIIPTFWTYDEDWQATNNMFNQAYSIDFKIPTLIQGEDAFGKPAEEDTTFLKSNVNISLTLMVDSSNGYIATGYCDFKFVKNENGEWHLSEWRDHTAQ